MRKSLVTKNQQFQELIEQAEKNQVDFVHILADTWFGSKTNMQCIQEMKIFFVFGLKSNRTVALSEADKKKGRFVQLKTLDLLEGQSKKIWIK